LRNQVCTVQEDLIKHEERAAKEAKDITKRMKREKENHISELVRQKDRIFSEMEAELLAKHQSAIAERD
jgi:hypothetical protein